MKSCSFLIFFLSVVTVNSIRGVVPTEESKYTGKKWTCGSGKVVDASMINDDYCDCTDGSDEPGTSACVHGKFFCSNVGHKSGFIPSSQVNDGVCDCCDGNDEYNGRNTCFNNCLELGKESLQDTLTAIKRQETGLQIRAQQIAENQVKKEENEKQLAAVKAKYAELKIAWEEKKAKKEEENQKEQQEKDRRNKETEALGAQRASSSESAESTTDSSGAATSDDSSSQIREVTETFAESANEHFPYPQEYAAPPMTPEKENPAQLEEPKADNPQTTEAFPYPAEYAYKEKQIEEKEEEVPADVDPVEEQKDEQEDQYVSPAAEEARRLFEQIDGDYTSMKKEMERLEKELGNDYGAENEFMSLKDQCVSVVVKQYTYEVCPYSSAAQKESGSTSLGNWDGIEREDEKLAMKFVNGQTCWQGPARSLKVYMECGASNELHTIEEPSKCVYTARLRTPAACSEKDLEHLKASVPAEHLHSEL